MKIEVKKLIMEKIEFNLRFIIENLVLFFVLKVMEKGIEFYLMIFLDVFEEVIGDLLRFR